MFTNNFNFKTFEDLLKSIENLNPFYSGPEFTYTKFIGKIGDKTYTDINEFMKAVNTDQVKSKNLIDDKIDTIKQMIDQFIEEDTPESYQKAAQKKQELQELLAKQDEYSKLLESKEEAIKNEDYEKAAQVSQEINGLLNITSIEQKEAD